VPQLNPVFREFGKMLNEALLDLKNLDADLCSKVGTYVVGFGTLLVQL